MSIIEQKKNTLWIDSKHQHEQKLDIRKLTNQIKKSFEQQIDNEN